INPTPNVAFTYDPDFPRVASMTDGTGTTTYGYVAVGALGALKLQSEDGPLPNDRISYAYDALGRIASRSGSGASPEAFRYDKIGRLVSYTDGLGKSLLTYLGETGQPLSRKAEGGIATELRYLPNSGDRRLSAIVNTPGRQFDYTTTPQHLIT